MDTQGHRTFTIGVTGSDDGDGEALLTVFLHQQFLAGNLVAGVLPIRISERGALGDDMTRSWLVIGRG
jgi:hypothetical protein